MFSKQELYWPYKSSVITASEGRAVYLPEFNVNNINTVFIINYCLHFSDNPNVHQSHIEKAGLMS